MLGPFSLLYEYIRSITQTNSLLIQPKPCIKANGQVSFPRSGKRVSFDHKLTYYEEQTLRNEYGSETNKLPLAQLKSVLIQRSNSKRMADKVPQMLIKPIAITDRRHDLFASLYVTNDMLYQHYVDELKKTESVRTRVETGRPLCVYSLIKDAPKKMIYSH